jgi:uncharacterized membrane-anchored protein
VTTESRDGGVAPAQPVAKSQWQHLGTKVPQLTGYFWIIKILTTGMGEAISDYLAHQYGPIPAVTIGGLFFVAALALQLRVKTYVPWIYWVAVAMVSVFGTMAADGLHIEFHVAYKYSTALYAVALTAILVAWYKSEHTLSIHSIITPRREIFYWLTVLATFALGTATGDLTAATLHLGWFWSGVLFTLAFAIPGLAYWRFRVHPVLCFWVAYVLTRPLGASWADWLGVPRDLSGLDWGRGTVSLLTGACFVVLVAFMQLSGRDVPPLTPALEQ